MHRYSPIFVVIMLVSGCTRRIEYAVENDTSHRLTDVVVTSDSGHRFSHGVLIPKSPSSFSGGGEKIAGQNRFIVSWRDETGAEHKAGIELSAAELTNSKVRLLRITDEMALEKGWLLEN